MVEFRSDNGSNVVSPLCHLNSEMISASQETNTNPFKIDTSSGRCVVDTCIRSKGVCVCVMNRMFLLYRVSLYSELNKFLLAANARMELVVCGPLLTADVRKSIEESAVPTTYLVKEVMIGDPTKLTRRYFRILYQPGLLRTLFRVRPSVVLSEGFGFWTLCALLGKLVWNAKLCIFWERTEYTERHNSGIKNRYYRMMAKAADALFVNGRETKRLLLAFGVPEKTITTGAMATQFRSSEVPLRIFASPPHKVLFAGKLTPEKGFDVFLEAVRWSLSNTSQLTFTICGEGPLGTAVKDLAKESRGRVRYLGFVPQREIGAVYDDHDVLVLPTLQDNWSLACVEAITRGLIVSTTAENGMIYDFPELLNFQIVPSLESLSSLMQRLEKESSPLTEIRERLRKSGMVYCADNVAKRLTTAIVSLLKVDDTNASCMPPEPERACPYHPE